MLAFSYMVILWQKKKKASSGWKMRKEYFIAHKVLLIKMVEIVSIMSLIECWLSLNCRSDGARAWE